MHDLFQKRFLVFGHRGAPNYAPENTIVSFKKAIELGVDGLEIDVLEMADGELVIHHDLSLERFGVDKNVGDVNCKEIKTLNAAMDMHDEFGFQAIPLLSEIPELLQDNELIINIEIKSPGLLPTAVVKKTIKFIIDYNLINRCIVSSFNPLILRKVKKLLPEVFTSLIWSREDVHWSLLWYKPLYWVCRPNGFHPDIQFLTQEIVDWAKSKKLKIVVFTVNTPEQLKLAQKFGLDGIFTDDPLLVGNNQK